MILCFLMSNSHYKTRGSRAGQLEGDQSLEFFALFGIQSGVFGYLDLA